MSLTPLRLGGCCRENSPDRVDLAYRRGHGRDMFIFLEFEAGVLEGADGAREMRRRPRCESDR